jgi:hypothetical protein
LASDHTKNSFLLQHTWFSGLEREDGTVLRGLIKQTKDAESAYALGSPTATAATTKDNTVTGTV